VRFGDYDLDACVGTGGMAEVWKARHRASRARVVVKRLMPHVATPDTAALFAREARVAMALDHPNIVRTLDVGISGDIPFVATELIDGSDLRAFLQGWLTKRGAPPPIALTAFVVACVSRGLGYAHAQGVIHRDVSPSNVLLGRDGSVKLADFGLAKVAFESISRSLSTVRGKPGYVAPEVLEGHPSDHRADVFGLGVVLHEMATGRRLFRGRTPFETLALTMRCEVAAPSTFDDAVPPSVDRVCLAALARDPAHRLADVLEIARVLDPLGASGKSALKRALDG
jgi:serine/threonine protein kinase